MDELVMSNQIHGVTNQVMLKRQGHGQITVMLAANINPISVGYMKNKICLVNERISQWKIALC